MPTLTYRATAPLVTFDPAATSAGGEKEQCLGPVYELDAVIGEVLRVDTQAISPAISAIGEDAWVSIEFPEGGEAWAAETTYGARRLVIRRTRLAGPGHAVARPASLAFLSELEGAATELGVFQRQHQVVELDIRDLKEGAGLEHCPSGNFGVAFEQAPPPCALSPSHQPDAPRGSARPQTLSPRG